MNPQLTDREKTILKMWAIGAQAKTICVLMDISISTFNADLNKIKFKYGVFTNTELRIIYLTEILNIIESQR
jgi:DNA-binding CsgD family transcriptional regulator